MEYNRLTTTRRWPSGLHISCELIPDAQGNPELSARVSAVLNKDIRVASSLWVFSGSGHELAADFATGILNRVAQKRPDEFSGLGAMTIGGQQNLDPVVFLPIGSGETFRSQRSIDERTLQLVMEANVMFEAGLSPLKLPIVEQPPA